MIRLMRSPALAGVLVGILMAIFFSVAFNAQTHGWLSWYQLAMSGKKIHAKVISNNPKIHQTCSFEYIVNSTRYVASDQGCDYKVGDIITVHYLPTDPAFATSSSPINQLLLMIIALLVLSVLGGFGTAWRIRRRLRKR